MNIYSYISCDVTTFQLALYKVTDLRKEHSAPVLGMKQTVDWLDPEDGCTTLLQNVDHITSRHGVRKEEIEL